MKFLLDNWMLISVALSSGGLLLWPVLRSAGGGLNAAGVVQLINRDKAVLLDVGEPAEFAKQHAGGARNLPFGQIEQRIGELVKNKNLPVVLLCPSGARAQRAVGMLKKLGYANTQALSGGTRAWQDAGLPLEKA